jgi:trans-2,3-dihydro-3-hydroxyanthranilate isomerase
VPTGQEYVHVDVFATAPYGGNSLPVFLNARGLSDIQMLRITQELRHFEAVFLEPTDLANTVGARVFDQFEELPFAGHPLLGAAAVLHAESGSLRSHTWRMQLQSRTVVLTTDRKGDRYRAWMDQGPPLFLGTIPKSADLAEAVGLGETDLHTDLPAEVVSTGLRYLIVPVAPGSLQRAKIRNDVTALLQTVRAQFLVIFDAAALEIRHWNNDGVVEDAATGSAAGTIGAYRLRHGLTPGGMMFSLHQGRFLDRPSVLLVQPEGVSDAIATVRVGGDVVLLGRGHIDILP